MKALRLVAAVGFAWLVATETPINAQTPARKPAGMAGVRWIGQDGHDYVGPNNRLEPSDVQDIHLVLTGLDPDREIVFIDVTASQHDQWQYNAESFSWKAELKRARGSRTADLFIEPGHVEAPRIHHVLYKDDQGATREFDVRGQKVSRSLRMPGAALQAKWLGQDRRDRVGNGPSVGPDGLQDVRIRLSGVSTKVPVKAFRIEGAGGAKWESGSNPALLPNAEFVADEKKPGEGDLHFQPDRELKGQKLKVLVLYANETLDSALVLAARCDSKLRMPDVPLPRHTETVATARWLGQDGLDAARPGDVHVRLSLRSRPASIVGAVLTDSVRGTWVYRANDAVRLFVPEGEATGRLALNPGSDPKDIELHFAPYRDETRATMTLRLVDRDGRATVTRFPGGVCDPGRSAPRPAATSVQARPGDDLNALANRHGTVNLGPGTYRLNRPLILEKPVTINGQGQATLVFTQAPGEPPWTTAIKIHAGHTTLRSFAVRFEGSIRWDSDVSYGAAVIGTTDNKDQGHNDLKVNLTLAELDLETPAAEDSSKWVEDMRLMRFTNAHGGLVTKCVLRGGPIEFFDGPWHFVENQFRGTPAGKFSYGVFAGHGTHDLLIRGNRTEATPGAGKTWRFVTLTHRGSGDRIEDNTIEGIGSREGDTIPWSNAPEIILTEAYHLTFEGKVVGLSADGLLLKTHPPQGRDASTGDVVALLTGPAAGQYRRIAQVLEPTAYVVDAPIPKGTEVVSIGRGFVDETIQKNRIDIRGGTKSDGLVLVGNRFGIKILGNHILGGSRSVFLTACPTETPVVWGWSHAPCLQALVEGNTFEDALNGAVLGVEHAPQNIKTSRGRLYMTLNLTRNTVRWTDAFLRRVAESGGKELPPAMTLGFAPSHDAGEFVVKAAGNRLDAPPGTRPSSSLVIHAAEFNGQKVLNRKFSMQFLNGGDGEIRTTTGSGDSPRGSRR